MILKKTKTESNPYKTDGYSDPCEWTKMNVKTSLFITDEK